MNATTARRLCLLRAVEEHDEQFRLFSERDRAAATTAAGPAPAVSAPGEPWAAEQEAFLVRRAEPLWARLQRTRPSLAPLARSTVGSAGITAGVVGLAFLLGAIGVDVDAHQRLNLIAFPLLGLLAWNLGFYGLLLWAAFRRGRGAGRHDPAPPAWLVALLQRRWRRRAAADGDAALEAVIAGRFVRDWTQWAAPMYAARGHKILHLGAASIAVGMIVGLYARGLALEYRAGWESTFLEPAAVAGLLRFVLAPAAWLTNLPLPTAAELAGLAWSVNPVGENAARWIHLYGVTAGGVIVIPRLLLAAAAAAAERRAARQFALPTGDGFWRRILMTASGAGQRVRVLALGFHPTTETERAVHRLMAEVAGGRVEWQLDPPIVYGQEDERLAALANQPAVEAQWMLVVVNLAATPESEVHGHALAELQRLHVRGRLGERLLLLADASTFRDATGHRAGERFEQRLAVWRRIALPAGLEPIVIGTHLTPDDLAAAVETVRHTQASPPQPVA